MPTSTWNAVVARIVQQLQTIQDIGQVHDRERLVYTQDEIYAIGDAIIGGEHKFRCWMVHLQSVDNAWADASGAQQWNRTVLIDGYLQVEDPLSSEHAAMALAEAITRTLAADWQATRMGGLVLAADPPKLVSSAPKFFGFVGVHFVSLRMPLITLEF
jgi:hypothetical protein